MKKIISLIPFICLLLLPLILKAEIEIPNPLKYNSFEELILNIIQFLFMLAIPVVALIIVIAAFILLTSGGEVKKVEQARNIIIWAIVGLIIIFLSFAIVDFIKKAIGVEEYDNSSTIEKTIKYV